MGGRASQALRVFYSRVLVDQVSDWNGRKSDYLTEPMFIENA